MTLEDLLREHRVPFAVGGEHRHVREGWIGLDCPFCGDRGKWHLGINLDSLAASCWRCGAHPVAEVLALLLPLTTPQIWGFLKALPRRPRTASEAGVRGRVLDLPKGLGPLSAAHRGYLRGRGFDPWVLEREWGLRGIGLAGSLAWRIWIPVKMGGRVVTWTTRSIRSGKGELKYVHADPSQELIPIKSTLYGWDRVRHSVIVCEGPADVWRIGPGAVAVFGLNVSSSQMEMLSRVPKRTICFDREENAQRRAERLADDLSAFPGETMVARLDSPDPGEASEEEVEELRGLLT